MHALNASTWLKGFLDDGSAFPPTSTPLDQAVVDFRQHQQAGYAELIDSLVVPDVKLPDLIDVLDGLDDADETAIPISLLVTGGAGAIESAVRWASRSPLVGLQRLELALRNEEDLAHNAQRFVAALDACETELVEVPAFVVLPEFGDQPPHGWLAALDVLAGADLGVRLRGTAPVTTIALTIDAALDRELSLRGSGVSTALSTDGGAIGFLNLLRAVRGCLDGEDPETLLQETSAEALFAGQDGEGLARSRRWLTGVGVPSVLEAHDDLVDLGLVTTL